MDKRTKTSRDVGNWIAVGVANEIGAAIGWRKPKDKNDK